jgi:hypothetical protein
VHSVVMEETPAGLLVAGFCQRRRASMAGHVLEACGSDYEEMGSSCFD